MGRDDTKERNAEIVRLRMEENATLEELAVKFGISRERVLQITKASGIDPRVAAAGAQERRKRERMAKAEEMSSIILMRWIDGEDIKEIAKDLDIGIIPARAVLDELVTDQIIAARSNARLTNSEGPRDAGKTPREDRYWTQDRVFAYLVDYAKTLGGLPSSTQYMKEAKGSDEMPSFATVRNRCGRWSAVRAEVHAHIKESA